MLWSCAHALDCLVLCGVVLCGVDLRAAYTSPSCRVPNAATQSPAVLCARLYVVRHFGVLVKEDPATALFCGVDECRRGHDTDAWWIIIANGSSSNQNRLASLVLYDCMCVRCSPPVPLLQLPIVRSRWCGARARCRGRPPPPSCLTEWVVVCLRLVLCINSHCTHETGRVSTLNVTQGVPPGQQPSLTPHFS